MRCKSSAGSACVAVLLGSSGGAQERSTIAYAVDGRQYVAVVNGAGSIGARGLAASPDFALPESRGNAINVLALPR
jgi:hypothetical protein